MQNGTKLIAKTAAAFALAAGLTLVSQAGATAAATVTVTPASALTDGATVTVSATGLAANEAHFIGLCGVIGSDFACDATGVAPVTTDGTGAATAPLTVRKSFTGTLGSGTTTPVDCGAITCIIGVYNADASAGANTPVTFG
ncbi:neocarzinostatin [Saccharothrix sp. AJ9571]|nr:neocarzinostatin [Saccharothrix sp. AJ9571]